MLAGKRWQTLSSDRQRCRQACDRIQGSCLIRSANVERDPLPASPVLPSSQIACLGCPDIAWHGDMEELAHNRWAWLFRSGTRNFKHCRTVLALQRSDCQVACLAAALVSDRFGPRRNAKLLAGWRTNCEPSHGSCASRAPWDFSRPHQNNTESAMLPSSSLVGSAASGANPSAGTPPSFQPRWGTTLLERGKASSQLTHTIGLMEASAFAIQRVKWTKS